MALHLGDPWPWVRCPTGPTTFNGEALVSSGAAEAVGGRRRQEKCPDGARHIEGEKVSSSSCSPIVRDPAYNPRGVKVLAGHLGPETCSIGQGSPYEFPVLGPYLQSSGCRATQMLEEKSPKRTEVPRRNKWPVGRASSSIHFRLPCQGAIVPTEPVPRFWSLFSGVGMPLPAIAVVAMPDAASREGLSTFMSSTVSLVAPSWRASFPRMYAIYSNSPSDNLRRRFRAAPAGCWLAGWW